MSAPSPAAAPARAVFVFGHIVDGWQLLEAKRAGDLSEFHVREVAR